MRNAQAQVVRGEGASLEVRRLLNLLQERGWKPWERYTGHLQVSSVAHSNTTQKHPARLSLMLLWGFMCFPFFFVAKVLEQLETHLAFYP